MSAKGSNITFNIKIDEGIIFTITLTNCQKLNTISAVIRGKKLKSCTPEALLKSYGALNFNYSKDGSKIESTVWNDTISMSDAPNGTNISSGDGKDKITGSAYKDVINSGAGNDKISAGAGDDYINAGKGKDKIILNSGNNTVVFTKGDGEDTVVKGSGSDILQFKNFKNISALKKGFKLSKSGKNLVIKYTSKDKVTLKDFYKDGTSVVTLKSKDGKAIKFTDFYSSYIFNTYIGKNGKAFKKTGTDLNDLIKGANKNDSLKGGKGYDKLYGYNGKDTIYGGADNDYIDGGKHDDKLYGDAGNDTIKGGAGNDSIKGGVGNDVINAGAGKNSIYYSLGDGNDIIRKRYVDRRKVSIIKISCGNLFATAGNDVSHTADEFVGRGHSLKVLGIRDGSNEILRCCHEAFLTISIHRNSFQRGSLLNHDGRGVRCTGSRWCGTINGVVDSYTFGCAADGDRLCLCVASCSRRKRRLRYIDSGCSI
jgi:Ca2+-binding RTX toxin-like protein